MTVSLNVFDPAPDRRTHQHVYSGTIYLRGWTKQWVWRIRRAQRRLLMYYRLAVSGPEAHKVACECKICGADESVKILKELTA